MIKIPPKALKEHLKDKPPRKYRYTLTYLSAPHTEITKVYSELPEDKLDELDALGWFWKLEVTTEEAARERDKKGWKGLYR